jgi:hypothetical protein
MLTKIFYIVGSNPYSGCKINQSGAKPDFNTKRSISGLLYDRVCLDESFPMGPGSTSGDENSLRYDLGRTTATAMSALSRETPTKETPETAETHVEKRLQTPEKRLKTPEERLRSTSASRWWLVWVSGGRKWVLGSS